MKLHFFVMMPNYLLQFLLVLYFEANPGNFYIFGHHMIRITISPLKKLGPTVDGALAPPVLWLPCFW